MKKLLWLVAVGAAGMALAADSTRSPQAEPLTQRVTPEEFKAAGLSKLSPEELAKLNALFGKYGGRTDALVAPLASVAAQNPRPADSTSSRQAEIEAAAAARVAEAEARARKAEQEAAAAREAAQVAKAEQKKAEEGLLAKARKVFVSPGTKVEVAAIETEIDGDFTGWEEMTVWRMKDGSMWRVDNRPQAYQVKRVTAPKVRIYPASLNGFWLEFVDLDLKLRVRQLK